jgi:shikimate kinase
MNEKLKNIVLTGFRATGKSSVGRLLAQKMGYSFIDTDALLCERLGAPIAEIVARQGWAFFREAERQLLKEVPGMVQTVLATGGGAIEHQEEWRQLRDSGYIVWLDADVETIRQRLGGDPHSTLQRPSLTGRLAGEEIEELLLRRAPLYSAGSDLRLDTAGKEPAVLVESIVEQLVFLATAGNCVAQGNECERREGKGK